MSYKSKPCRHDRCIAACRYRQSSLAQVVAPANSAPEPSQEKVTVTVCRTRRSGYTGPQSPSIDYVVVQRLALSLDQSPGFHACSAPGL